MRWTGEIEEAHRRLDGKLLLTVTVNEGERILPLIGKTNEQTYVFEAQKPRKKRSLTANAYYWQLITQMAEKLKIPVPEMHNRLLRRYGQSVCIDGVLMTVFIPDTDKAEQEALMAETFHIRPTTYVQEGTHGRIFRQYIVLRGSSTYDSREMGTLIDGAVSEAKELGIETLTPHEISIMVAAMGARHV